jgi:predicted transcriptional regulator
MSAITLQLDLANRQRLEQLAKRHGRDASQLATHIIEAYLDARDWSRDSAEQWAEASTTLAAEIFADEEWTEGDLADGPR